MAVDAAVKEAVIKVAHPSLDERQAKGQAGRRADASR